MKPTPLIGQQIVDLIGLQQREILLSHKRTISNDHEGRRLASEQPSGMATELCYLPIGSRRVEGQDWASSPPRPASPACREIYIFQQNLRRHLLDEVSRGDSISLNI